MNATSLQAQLFDSLKSRLSPGTSLVDEIARVLDISNDSAYRRLRGEKPLSFEELYRLCDCYKLSLDTLFNLKTDIVPFQGNYVDSATFRFESYLAAVEQQVKYMASFRQRSLYYLCKDIPLFHHYAFRELAAFKYFFWHRTLLHSPEFVQKKVALSAYPDEVFATGRRVLDAYNQLDSYEIWNMESLNGTLRQVEYYHDIKAFESPDDLLQVYEALERLFFHLEKQAELGYKFDSADPAQQAAGSFHMYYNEVVIGDNSMLAVLDNARMAIITHTGINFMITRDLAFCENLHNFYQNLMRTSTLISTVSARERSRFFHLLRRRIEVRKQNVHTAV